MSTLKHSRTVYNMIDFIGDLGGVIELITLLFGFFLLPIAEHSFLINAIQNLF